MKSSLNIFSTVFFLFFLLSACGGETTEQPAAEAPGSASAEESAVYESSNEFRTQLETALDSYFKLSAALIDTDSGTASETAPSLTTGMQAIETGSLDDAALAHYNEAYDTITSRSEAISQLNDADQQRYEFEYLSEAMIGLVENFGPLSFTVYVQRCPMVREGSADWLSRESGILNPYHGNRMLRCGSIVREI